MIETPVSIIIVVFGGLLNIVSLLACFFFAILVIPFKFVRGYEPRTNLKGMFFEIARTAISISIMWLIIYLLKHYILLGSSIYIFSVLLFISLSMYSYSKVPGRIVVTSLYTLVLFVNNSIKSKLVKVLANMNKHMIDLSYMHKDAQILYHYTKYYKYLTSGTTTVKYKKDNFKKNTSTTQKRFYTKHISNVASTFLKSYQSTQNSTVPKSTIKVLSNVTNIYKNTYNTKLSNSENMHNFLKKNAIPLSKFKTIGATAKISKFYDFNLDGKILT